MASSCRVISASSRAAAEDVLPYSCSIAECSVSMMDFSWFAFCRSDSIDSMSISVRLFFRSTISDWRELVFGARSQWASVSRMRFALSQLYSCDPLENCAVLWRFEFFTILPRTPSSTISQSRSVMPTDLIVYVCIYDKKTSIEIS